MAGVSAAETALGVIISVAACVVSGLVDRSLTSYDFWLHYAPSQAKVVRRLTLIAHGCAGLAAGLVFVNVLNWYPFGDDAWQVATAGLAWAAAGEALLRAEVVVVDMSAAKPGVTLLRKVLSSAYTKLDTKVDEGVNDHIRARTGSDQGLMDLLEECLGAAAAAGPHAQAATVLTASHVAEKLNGSPAEHAGAKVAALQAIHAEVTAQQKRL